MLRIDPSTKELVEVSATTLTEANIMERDGLQNAIIGSWEAFCNELGYEELFLIGSEIVPHDSCDDRIDILALGRNGCPVVFELKRHKHKLQLLQALSYAAMVSHWDAQRFLERLGAKKDEAAEELKSLLNDDDFQLDTPKIVLIAESFDPEVILAADWLSSEFGVPVSAFAVAVTDHKGETLISIDQKFPLPGVEDVYVRRGHRIGSGPNTTTWEEALKSVSFSFAARAVEIFRRRSDGSPHRRAFPSIYAGTPLGRMSIAFKRNYLKVYTAKQSPEAEKALRNGLGDVVPFKKWGGETTANSGFTFTIETEAQFEKFLSAVGETKE